LSGASRFRLPYRTDQRPPEALSSTTWATVPHRVYRALCGVWQAHQRPYAGLNPTAWARTRERSRHGGAPPEACASVSLFALYPNWCLRTGETEKKRRFRFLARIKTVVRAPVPRASIPDRGKGGMACPSPRAGHQKPPVIHAGIDARAHRCRFWRMHTDRTDMHRGPWPMQKRGGMHEKHVDYHAGRPCGWPKRGRLASITLISWGLYLVLFTRRFVLCTLPVYFT